LTNDYFLTIENKHLNISQPSLTVSVMLQLQEATVAAFITVMVTTAILLYFYNPNGKDGG
jgi:hypothetical protein